ncbi:NAD(P)/FAD-dependent oxidoreductase [Pseudotamlana agarivorans]|uniref:NAD(P)/FAD-dependent oxidoreductase n=1 Tax=Pseudotamlana agarivorans TaxID=481183 RepID=UPI00082C60D9|nr:NAD(P)/FAD-dependent oxidoreductase [Tamlana agarivorans]
MKNYEVIIIGGSYAGLSAALALGRSLREVLIIDARQPCNQQTPHSQNFLTQDGETPQAISEKAKAQVSLYKTITFLDDFALSGTKTATEFEISTKSKGIFSAKKIILATGVKDIMPNIKGFSECWGISVIHCPYCHGYEHKGVKTAILTNQAHALHLAPLVKNLNPDLIILTQGAYQFNNEEITKLEANNISIINKEITEIIHENGYLNAVLFNDGTKENFEAIYASVPFEQHGDISKQLGCAFTEQGHIETNMFQQTAIEGIYACGDNSSPMRSVAYAVSTGNIAGAMINKELCDQDF